MARVKNDNFILNTHQKLSFLDDDQTEAASMSWDGEQMVLTGFTISGSVGPAGPAGTGVPGNYIGDEDGNTRVTINTIDHIILRTDGTDHLILDDNGQLLFGDDNTTTTQGKFNLVHTGNASFVMDNHGGSAEPAGQWFRKSRGGRDLPAVVLNQDNLGDIRFWGYGGSSYLNGALIQAKVSGTPTSANMPTSIDFYTTNTTWAAKQRGLRIQSDGHILLSSGTTANEIRSTLDNGYPYALVTSAGIYDAVTQVRSYVDSVLTTISGLDVSMSTLFDPTYSGTEVKIYNDEILFKNQGTEVAKFNSAGNFELGDHYANNIFNGNLGVEASSTALPTAAAVKSYVDSHGPSSGVIGTKLLTDSGVTSWELNDLAILGTMANEPIVNMFQYSYGQGVMYGYKTRHIYLGDQIDNLPEEFLFGNTPIDKPALLLHSLGGSRFYAYNKKSYGDDALPYHQTPGLVIHRDGTSDGDSRGLITWGNIQIEAFQSNSEEWPTLPNTEHELRIHCGTYGAYSGEVLAQNQSIGGSYPGGIVKLFCKLRFGNAYMWGNENPNDYVHPYSTDDMATWGSFGNNVWVNRIAGCHYTKTEEEVGTRDTSPEAFIGTGNDDHCLVTGKYVHTAIDVATDAWEAKLSDNKIYNDGTDGFDLIENRVQVGRRGVYLTYGYLQEWDSYLWLARGDKRDPATRLASGAYFRSQEGFHNRVIIESTSPGAGDPLLEEGSDYHTTAAKLLFFRSRRSYLGTPNDYGNAAVVSGDILGSISWQGQALNTGITRNPCEHYSNYKDSAYIRVFAQTVTDTTVTSRMELRGGSSIISMEEDGNFVMGSKKNLLYGSLASAGHAHIVTAGYGHPRESLDGFLTITDTQRPSNGGVPSIIFTGKALGAGEVGKYTGAYSSRADNAWSVPYAKIIGQSDDPQDYTNNGGRLTLSIHKHGAVVMSEQLRITAGGKVIVGDEDAGQTCAIANPGAKFTIAQTTNTYTGGLGLVSSTSAAGSYIFVNSGGELTLASASDGSRQLNINTGDGIVRIGGSTNNGAEYSVMVNGSIVPAVNNLYDLGSTNYKWDDVWATNGTIQTSDAKYKEDVKTANLGLDFVRGMRPVSYKRKEGERRHWGFIAQEIEKLVGKFGRRTRDAAFLIKDEKGDYGLRYEELIPIIVKALQELADKVEA